MVAIIVVEHDSTVHGIDIADGHSLMEGAIAAGVPGIEAICGGKCSCATCHVFVVDEWIAAVGPPSASESELLGLVSCADHRSRLSCQIEISPELAGLKVILPEFQE